MMKNGMVSFAQCALWGGMFLLLSLHPAPACTDARIVAQDGAVMTARSMEFGIPMDSRLVVRPRGTALESPAPNGAKGVHWKAKYGFVYLDGLHLDAAVDGLNEAGLGVGVLFFPGYAGYESPAPADNAQALSHIQFSTWVLSQFATIDEVKAALPGVKVWGESLADLGLLPLHYVIHDAQGKSIVCEWVGGKLTVYDNTAGVMTNSPAYDWHMTNLTNYVRLSPDNAKAQKIGGVTYAATGQGSGLLGMPGDPSPPSRLIQTVFALNTAVKPKDADEALVLAQKLMNRVDIPRGLARDPNTGNDDTAEWAVFRDHTHKVYYYRTYGDMTPQALDLKKLDFSPGAPARRLAIGTPKPTIHRIDPASLTVFK
jgi:choloylglycine hydrolase